MIVYPNCKINLGLNVLSRRADGYHNIESIFYPVPWHDMLEIIPSDDCHFNFNGLNVNCAREENLCFRAYNLIKRQVNIPDIDLFLYKQIPFGAGLGGGSADATFTLKALNELFSLNLGDDKIAEMASSLGSDCAFFVQNSPCYVTGTGTTLCPLNLSLKGFYLVIVKPDVFVSTKEAYKMIIPRHPVVSLPDLIKAPVTEWKNTIINDFEEPVFSKYPLIRQIREKLYESGAVYASMSGSGSAVYGLFEQKMTIAGEFDHCIVWQGFLS